MSQIGQLPPGNRGLAHTANAGTSVVFGEARLRRAAAAVCALSNAHPTETPPCSHVRCRLQPFQHRWQTSTDNGTRWLHSTLVNVTPGAVTPVAVGGASTVGVRLPLEGAGVSGVLLGDPCTEPGGSPSLSESRCPRSRSLAALRPLAALLASVVPCVCDHPLGHTWFEFWDESGGELILTFRLRTVLFNPEGG